MSEIEEIERRRKLREQQREEARKRQEAEIAAIEQRFVALNIHCCLQMTDDCSFLCRLVGSSGNVRAKSDLPNCLQPIVAHAHRHVVVCRKLICVKIQCYIVMTVL